MHHAARPLPLTGPAAQPDPRHKYRECRALWEMAQMVLRWRDPGRIQDGNGQHVLLIPGYGGSERSLAPMRSWLNRHGYQAHHWGHGRNDGDVPVLVDKTQQRLDDLYNRLGQKIALVGWSLGGYLAREIARDNPDRVSQVISLGTPVIGGPKYTRIAPDYIAKGIDLDAWEHEVAARYDTPITVPVTVLYCPRDGVVAPEACHDHWTPQARNIRVNAPHLGMGFSPDVLNLVARMLMLNDKTRHD